MYVAHIPFFLNSYCIIMIIINKCYSHKEFVMEAFLRLMRGGSR